MQGRVIRIQFSMLLIVWGVFMLFTGCENSLLDSTVMTEETKSGDRGTMDQFSSNSDGLYVGGEDYYPGTERHGELSYNGFVLAEEDNLSTFGVDVDAGSYTFGRKKINEGIVPAPSSVRVEEYINYFHQDYPAPDNEPFSVSVDGAPSPFRAENLHLLRIGLKGREANSDDVPWNLTFLIDISGSMRTRLDLVKESLNILVDNMRLGDQVSICTYAGSVGTVLNPTDLQENDADAIKAVISDLEAGGSTAMASGLQNAYDVNSLGFLDGGVNRIIVCSDGDANVGATSHEAILELIEEYVDQGITLSTLGFGSGNYNDHLMEQLADQGNGNYYYIDTINEAERLFTEELSGVMEVIAKDVKIQVEFNAASVLRYRLIGYENRDIEDDQFENDSTDAGEIGAGHRVTALYELELTQSGPNNLGTVHLRYKMPDGESDIPFDVPISRNDLADSFSQASDRFRFTAGVAEYAEIVRESPYVQTSLFAVESLIASSLIGSNEQDTELLELIRQLQTIE
ncbi:MAG: von Willebrand factor type A domain-containing protein [Candidatus Marinimicrobia bacterium]|nr:von Willebrand factor type A domain-containing protein [Candidatus Neomarinimicrobiota bacterium]